ncbi:hypothetical protein L1887_49860 [Cichorium endivia]|nr:hypothetical protein L1887_49860 [Cichorium endivia]
MCGGSSACALLCLRDFAGSSPMPVSLSKVRQQDVIMNESFLDEVRQTCERIASPTRSALVMEGPLPFVFVQECRMLSISDLGQQDLRPRLDHVPRNSQACSTGDDTVICGSMMRRWA